MTKITSISCIDMQSPSKEYLLTVRDEIKKYLPHTWTLPCGHSFSAVTVDDIPFESVPCPCGDPTHWLVKVVITL